MQCCGAGVHADVVLQEEQSWHQEFAAS
jgi:hypothetical protein